MEGRRSGEKSPSHLPLTNSGGGGQFYCLEGRKTEDDIKGSCDTASRFSFFWFTNFLVVGAFLLSLTSFSVKCAKGHSWDHGTEYGLSHELNEYVETPIMVLVCSVIFMLSMLASFIAKVVPNFRHLPNNSIFNCVVSTGIAVPLLVQGMPLLAFAFDVILSTGLGGVDVHVMQAFAIFGAVYLGRTREAVFLLMLFRFAHAIEDFSLTKAHTAKEILERSTPTLARLLEQPTIHPNLQLDNTMPDNTMPDNTMPLFKSSLELQKLSDDYFKSVPVADIKVGQIVKVNDKELIPLKGTILPGMAAAAYVTQSHVDGELIPLRLKPGSSVAAGASLVGGGPIFIKVTHTEEAGEIAQLKRLISASEGQKPPLENYFHRFEKVYSKCMVAIALLILLGLPRLPGNWAVPLRGPKGSAYRTVAFIVAGAPCALVLSTPVAYWCVFTRLLWNHVTLSDLSVVHDLTSVTDVVFDKTGTLTTNLEIVSVKQMNPVGNYNEILVDSDSILRAATALYLLEANAPSHPHATAAHKWAVDVLTRHNQTDIFGGKGPRLVGSVELDFDKRGLHGDILAGKSEYNCVVGSADYVAEATKSDRIRKTERHFEMGAFRGLSVLSISQKQPQPQQQGKSLPQLQQKQKELPLQQQLKQEALPHENLESDQMQQQRLLEPWKFVGPVEIYVLFYKDELRKGARKVVAELQKMGKEVWVLSGDYGTRVKDVADTIGIPPNNVKSSMRPKDKFELIQNMEKNGKRVAMVGDEANDAAAMKVASVGVAVGDSASDVVLSSDVAKVILNENPRKPKKSLSRLPYAMSEANRCEKIIIQNIVVAMFGLLVVAPAAVGAKIPLWVAVLGHEGGTLWVALNSMRLFVF